MIIKYYSLKSISVYTMFLVVCASLMITACENPEKSTENTSTKSSSKGPFAVTFDTGNVNVKVPKQVIKKGAKAIQPTEEKYSFDKWYIDKKCTIPFDFKNTKITKDITLYAGWPKNKKQDYTVTFNLVGGKADDGSDSIPDEIVPIGQTVSKPTAPTKNGFIFGEWHTDELCRFPFFFDTDTLVKNIILYAKWNNPGTFTVRFNSNGGSVIESETVTKGQIVSKPVAPIKAGYIFDNWYEDKERTTLFNFNTKINKNTTIYAHWKNKEKTYKEKTYTVMFDLMEGKANDGSDSIPDKTVIMGNAIVKPDLPVRSGYTFVDWYTDKKLTTKFNFSVPIIMDITIYAGWGYKISFDFNGGIGNRSTAVQTVLSGDTVTRPIIAPTKINAIFDKWYKDKECIELFDFTIKIHKDTVIYAGWNVTVSFEANGGTPKINQQTIKEGATAVKPKEPTRKGYTFENWYSDDIFTKVFSFNSKIKQHTILYAKWNRNQYKVSFDFNGGKGDKSTAVQTVLSGNTVTRPTIAPTKIHAIFDKWYKDKECIEPFDFTTKIHKDTVIYAGWHVTVSFETNGGIPKINQQTIKEGATAVKPKEPTRKGYTFENWYSDKARIIPFSFSSKIRKSITLYAGWHVTVSFETNGGTPKISQQTIKEGATAVKPTDPTRKGYVFDDWYSDKKLTISFDFGTPITKSLTLYAGWHVTVSFETNGGTPKINQQTIKEGATAVKPTEPTRKGYTFENWYSDKARIIPFSFSSKIRKSITLYAGWHVTVSFETNGGIPKINQQTIKEGTTAVKPKEPTRKGYTFENWYSDDIFTKVFSFNSKIKQRTILYAKWNRNQYKVSFDFNGGKGDKSTAVQTVLSGNTVTRPIIAPTKIHAIFDKWYKDKECIEPFDFTMKIHKDTVIYAGWRVTVSFETNGGIPKINQQTIKEGTTAVKPIEPTRKGYTFENWYSDDIFTKVFSFNSKIKQRTILYAKWNRNQYKVSFDFNGGKGDKSTAVQTVLSGNTVTRPIIAPTKIHAIFDKWYKDKECIEPFDFTMKIHKDTVIYAGWRVTVSFETNGGIPKINQQTIKEGTTAVKPKEPTRKGYTFENWYSDKARIIPFSFSSKIRKSITLYAGWHVTVSFETNGGTPKISPQTIKEGATAVKPIEPTRKGYTFENWYSDKARIIPFNFSSKIRKSITLYAGWRVTVSFETNGGIPKINPQTIKEGATAVKPKEPTRKGYVFDDWYSDKKLTISFDFGTPITKSLTLYAGWHVTVSFETNGGIPKINQQTIKEGATAVKPKEPTRKGYTFENWYSDDIFTKVFSFNSKIKQRTILYAKWNRNQYKVSFDFNGGKGDKSTAVQTVLSGNTVTRPIIAPTKIHAIFDKWYKDKECIEPFDFTMKIHKDTVIYAGWRVTVSFETNGGIPKINQQTIKEGTTAVKPKEPTRKGYTFENWYSDKARIIPFSFSSKIRKSITLYAGWHVTVSFETNGGTPKISPQTIKEGATAVKPIEPTRKGYTFENWYSDKARIIPFNFSSKIRKSITLYAGWRVTVSFETNGGIPKINPQTIKEGATAVKPKEPTRKGYVFDDWYSDKKLTISFDFGTPITKSLTLYAGWHVTVSFETNGGIPKINQQTIKEGATAVKPKEPTRKGYVFDDWYSDKARIIPFSFSSKIRKSITLYAGWYVTVSFETKGGIPKINQQTIKEGAKALKPTAPTRKGYVFDDWYSDKARIIPFDFGTPITKSLTLYAGWYVTVSFETNGGTPKISQQTIKEGATAVKPTDPTRKGYVFDDWYSDKKLTISFDFGTPITKSLTLYAGWHVTVSFETNGGIPKINQQIIKEGTTAVKPTDPTRKGYVFDDWYSDKARIIPFSFSSKIRKSITLYAGWYVTVSFETKGGIPKINQQTIKEGAKALKPTAPTRKGYVFDDWYSDKARIIPFDFDTPITKSLTLYAGWNVTVSFETNGGTPKISQQTIKEGATAVKPTDPTRKGYVFDDWYSDKKLTISFDFGTPITKSLTLYAGWNVTVNFSIKGGIPKINPQTIKEGATAVKPTDPTRKGYVFDDWYSDKARIIPFDFDTPITKSLTLYAGWYVTVSFETKGGIPKINQQTIKEGAKALKPTAPTRRGYVFDDWYSDKARIIPFDFDTPITKSLTLYAGWNVTVSFDTNAGSTINLKIIKKGAKVTSPTNPTRVGYIFDRWYTDKKLTIPFNFSSKIRKSITLYAGWNVTVSFDTNAGSTINPQIIKEGSKATRPKDNPIREGYGFDNWYADKKFTTVFNFDTKINTSITIYAKWISGWRRISVGDSYTVGIKADNTLWAWGNNDKGQLGLGDRNRRNNPQQVVFGTTWKAVDAGESHTAGIKADGTLWAWGDNRYGQLGLGSRVRSIDSPQQVAPGTVWKMIAVGVSYTVGIKADGTLWAWGGNHVGQLGLGDRKRRSSPEQVDTDKWLSVDAGRFYTIGIKADGTLWAWGMNREGQLGLGDNTNKNSPQQVGADTWSAIAVGKSHSVGIKKDGTFWAWGNNRSRQLGLGDRNKNSSYNSPQQVGTDTWYALATGESHTVGIKANGTLWAWGNNDKGQLGLGDRNRKSSPQQVSTEKWIAVAAGKSRTVGIKEADGNFLVWGSP